MIKFSRFALALMMVALFAGSALVSAAPKEPKDAKCPVSGKACNPAKSTDFAGGKVYFCCDNCAAAFKGESAKFAPKAHQQLVATGQLTQRTYTDKDGANRTVNELDVEEIGATLRFAAPTRTQEPALESATA